MRKVIRVDGGEFSNESVTFVAMLNCFEGWERLNCPTPRQMDKVVYLGKNKENKELFAGYQNNVVNIYKGHLNSGEY